MGHLATVVSALSRVSRNPAVRPLPIGPEPLEPRRLMAVTLDDQGWTTVTPEPDSRVIYVSSSTGSDSNNGLAKKKAVRTISHAVNLLRNGSADQMLLKAGDVWTGGFPQWIKSGRSASEPLVVGRYDTGPRPMIKTVHSGFTSGKTPIRHVRLMGIAFYAEGRDPYSASFSGPDAGRFGVNLLSATHDFTIEDCSFKSYGTNLNIQGHYGKASDITLRRSVITDAYDTDHHSQGLYVDNVNGFTLEENIFDHNGWNSAVAGAEATIHNHNVYFNYRNWDVTVRGNVIADAGSHGMQLRSGGDVYNNLFLRNPIGMSFGHVNGSRAVAGGIEGDISGNVFLGSRDINGASRGWAIELGNLKPGGKGTYFTKNIIANDTQRNFPAIRLMVGSGVHNAGETVGINDLQIARNVVYRWNKALGTADGLVAGGNGQTGFNRVRIEKNDFQQTFSDQLISHGKAVDANAERWAGNRYHIGSRGAPFRSGSDSVGWEAWNKYVDKTGKNAKAKYFAPQRTVETYHAALGGRAKLGAFMTQLREQSRQRWRDDYTIDTVMTYLREGFGLVKGAPRVIATNLSSPNLIPARKKIVFHFSQDVSATLDKWDLQITNRSSGNILDMDEAEMTYDRITNTATWTFPGLKKRMLTAGHYTFRLGASGIGETGATLDGDGDGIGGDNFIRKGVMKSVA